MQDEKIKYLEFLQTVIARMASNSFVSKGWSVTLATAIFALAAKDANPRFAVVGLVPVTLFWSLDAYYLVLERSFRKIYDDVRTLAAGATISFNLTPAAFTSQCWFKALFRPAVALVHVPMLIVVVALTIVGYRH